MIDARVIQFPVEVAELNAAVAHYRVPAGPVRELIGHEPFDITEGSPDMADLMVSALDYRRHAWGSFHSISISVLVRPRGFPTAPVGPFLYRSPVDQRFSCEVGRRAQGVTTEVQQIGVRYAPDDVTFSLTVDRRPTLELRFDRAPAAEKPVRSGNWVYTSVDGVAHGARLEFAFGTGWVPPAAVDMKLGASPLARTLRGLGLPRQPVSCTWGEQLTATYHLARPVADIMQFASHSLH